METRDRLAACCDPSTLDQNLEQVFDLIDYLPIFF